MDSLEPVELDEDDAILGPHDLVGFSAHERDLGVWRDRLDLSLAARFLDLPPLLLDVYQREVSVRPTDEELTLFVPGERRDVRAGALLFLGLLSNLMLFLSYLLFLL